MKSTHLKSTPAALNLEKNDCNLPMAILEIIEFFTTKHLLDISKSFTEGYLNCTGLGNKLLNNEWYNYFWKFPWLVVIFVLSALLPLICITWCISQFRRKRRRRFEKTPVIIWRHIFTALLFILKILFCFFLWFTYMSYHNHPVAHNTDTSKDRQMLSLFFDRTLDAINHVFNDNIDVMKDYMMNLAEDMRSSLYKSAPQLLKASSNESVLHKIYADSDWLQAILKEINEDMEVLLLDTMQLLDITRIFYRNTTTLMDMGNITDNKYKYLLDMENKACYHKMFTLLSIKRVLSNIHDIIEMSRGVAHLRETFSNNLNGLHNFYAFHFQNMWFDKVNQRHAYYGKIVSSVKKLRANIKSNVTIRLPKDVYAYQLLFIIIAALICFLCFVQLFYAVYHSVFMKFKKKKYILVAIVVLICTSAIILCLIASHSLFVGTSYYNLRQLIDSQDNPCGRDLNGYCDAYKRISRANGEETNRELKQNMELKNQHTNEVIHAALPYAANISNILQLTALSKFMGHIFNAGAIFDVVGQELNMENWYAAYEQLRLHVPLQEAYSTANSTSNQHQYYEKMLACNLDMLKMYLFEDLVGKEVVPRVRRLSKKTEILAANLPMKDFGALMRKCLDELRVVHDFIERELSQLLDSKTADMLRSYETELKAYNSHMALMPDCEQFKLSGIGMPRELFKCIEACLHGFWIGGFAILLLLFLILIVCMILTYIYDKYPYSRQGGTNTSAPRSSGGSSRSISTASLDEHNSPHVTFQASTSSPMQPNIERVAAAAGDRVTSGRRLAVAKMRDLIKSFMHPAANVEPQERQTSAKLESNASTSSEEASDNEAF